MTAVQNYDFVLNYLNNNRQEKIAQGKDMVVEQLYSQSPINYHVIYHLSLEAEELPIASGVKKSNTLRKCRSISEAVLTV